MFSDEREVQALVALLVKKGIITQAELDEAYKALQESEDTQDAAWMAERIKDHP